MPVINPGHGIVEDLTIGSHEPRQTSSKVLLVPGCGVRVMNYSKESRKWLKLIIMHLLTHFCISSPLESITL